MDDIRDIFFDLDHTIWDFDANSKLALQELFFEFDLTKRGVDFDAFMKEYYEVNDIYWARYRNNEIQRQELRIGRFIDAFANLDVRIDFDFADQFAGRYLELSPYKTNLFPNAIEVLTYLQSKFNLHIITNGFEEVQFIKLKHSNLKQFFKTVVCAEEVGEKKPHPSVFQYALDKSGANPKQAVMVGDSLQADVQGALDVGMHAIYFNPEMVDITADYKQIQDLAELKHWF